MRTRFESLMPFQSSTTPQPGAGEHAAVRLLGPGSHQATTSADGTWRLGKALAGAATAEKHQITGRVGGLGANHHATIRAVGPRSYSTTTRSDGTWTMANAVSGDYNVNATHSLYTFSPAFHHAVATTSDVHNMDFTAQPKAGGGSSKKK